jgi:hypothetical protein
MLTHGGSATDLLLLEFQYMAPEHWRQIEDLYHAAREQSNERAALLECTDPEIRARVERMLALDSSGQILNRPPTGIPVVLPDEHLWPYKIESLIGACGMVPCIAPSIPGWRGCHQDPDPTPERMVPDGSPRDFDPEPSSYLLAF